MSAPADPREKDGEAMGPIATNYAGAMVIVVPVGWGVAMAFGKSSGSEGADLFTIAGSTVAVVLVGVLLHFVESKTYRYRDGKRRGNWPPVSWWRA